MDIKSNLVTCGHFISIVHANSKKKETLFNRGCDKEGFEKPSKINGLGQQQTGNV